MEADLLTFDGAKVGMVFADIEYALWDDGTESEAPGNLYKVVEVCPPAAHGNARVMVVCVNDGDEDGGDPEAFALPLRCVVQAPHCVPLPA